MPTDTTALPLLLRSAAELAREAEMNNERIDSLDILVLPHGIVVRGARNDHGYGPRSVRSSRTVEWDEIGSSVHPFRQAIEEVVFEMNAPPTTVL